MIMNIAIIGGGWYGCHLAVSFLKNGIKFKLFESESELFSKASTHNQNRLHLGFHYPRSYQTRLQSAEGFYRFCEKYPFLMSDPFENLYGIDNKRSIIDFDTYLQIMNSSGLEFEISNIDDYPFKNLEGLIKTAERIIDPIKAKDYFSRALNDYIECDYKITEKMLEKKSKGFFLGGDYYDYIIDCTWAQSELKVDLDIYYEPCLIFTYEKKENDHFGLTIMDGEFVSLYPFRNKLYTLTSVKHTPLSKCLTIYEAKSYLSKIGIQEILSKRRMFEDEIAYFFPEFPMGFSYHGYYLGIKSKLNLSSDSREVVVRNDSGFITVFSGKIDAIFSANDRIAEIIGCSLL